MKDVAIEVFGLDQASHIYVKPVLALSADYSFIYRDATSVRWDEKYRRLYVLSEACSSPVDDYLRILAAVHREYGVRLVLTEGTVWVDVTAGLADQLRKAEPVIDG